MGVMAIGSHLENHGPALPIDTDSKIASYLALESSFRTGAKFLGILYAATEYHYVKHGVHLPPEDLVKKELIPTLKSARDNLDLHAVVLVNGHGGNLPIKDYIDEMENHLGLKIVLNNKIVEIEGPHAGTGELSMGAVLGIVDEARLDEHCNFEDYPEVGMVGLYEARKANRGINEAARTIKKEGVCIDPDKGKKLLETAVEAIVGDIKYLSGDLTH